ncbi:hypothetical protein X975_04941, partial [Stegodyphus mimosarum]
MSQGIFHHGWRSHRITEFFGVRRCFNCQDFEHSPKDCKYRNYCAFCGGAHNIKDCNADNPMCINCKLQNDVNNTNFNAYHPAYSAICPTYLRELQKVKARTEYEEIA